MGPLALSLACLIACLQLAILVVVLDIWVSVRRASGEKNTPPALRRIVKSLSTILPSGTSPRARSTKKRTTEREKPHVCDRVRELATAWYNRAALALSAWRKKTTEDSFDRALRPRLNANAKEFRSRAIEQTPHEGSPQRNATLTFAAAAVGSEECGDDLKQGVTSSTSSASQGDVEQTFIADICGNGDAYMSPRPRNRVRWALGPHDQRSPNEASSTATPTHGGTAAASPQRSTAGFTAKSGGQLSERFSQLSGASSSSSPPPPSSHLTRVVFNLRHNLAGWPRPASAANNSGRR